MKNDIVYVTGHRHPDSDSIVSAIAYSLFKQRQGIPAVACRLGEMNAESEYLLNRFHFEKPLLLEDARVTLDEIDLDDPVTFSPDTTIYEALEQMISENRQSYCVVNERGQVLGLVSKSDLADIGLGDTALGIALLKETSVDNICKTIKGKMIYNDNQLHFNGKVSIIAIADENLENYDIQNRLVIVGNNTSAQIKAIQKGAAILIVVWSKKIDEEVIKTAQKYHCSIIISGHGAMNTTRYLYFSPNVNLVMCRNVVSFHVNEFVEDVGKKMLKTRYRSYPVVDSDNVLKGYVSRYHILNAKNKKIILVDHNEYAQSVKNIGSAELLEVIDHHRVGDIFTSKPIFFRNEIIGSAATIITSMYMENQMSISKNLAGLLLGAILSDTLKFRSPTTTSKDIGMAEILAKTANLDIDDFAEEMFKVSSNICNKDIDKLIKQDIKKFNIDGNNVSITQIIVSSIQEIKNIENDLQSALDQFSKVNSYDLCVVALTSILENGSIFYSSGKLKESIFEAFPNVNGEAHSFHEGVLSRKNQIVPRLSHSMLNTFTNN